MEENGCFLFLFIFFVNYQKALQKEIFILNDLSFAVRNDLSRHTAGSDRRNLFPEFFFDPVDNAVYCGCVSVKDSALHTVHRVFSDQFLRFFYTDPA